MKKKLLLPLILFVIGCTHKDPQRPVTNIFIQSETMKLSGYLGRSYSIEIVGSHLIVRDDHIETKLTVFNLDNDPIEPIYTGHIGRGPGELINPGSIMADSNEFSIYDASQMQLYSFEIDSLTTSNYKPRKSIPIKEMGIIDIKRVNKDMFVSVGVFPENRFYLMDNLGSTICKLGSYPLGLTENVPEYVRGIAYQSMLTTNQDKCMVAVALRYGEHIQFYTVSNKCAIELLRQRSISLPEYTTRDNNGYPNFSPTEKTQWGYLSITSNADFVYALYSGKLQKSETDFYQGSEIHVFDWQGNFIQIIGLDQKSLAITCNQTQLYSLFEGGDGYEIAKYKL